MKRTILAWVSVGLYSITIFYPLSRLWFWLDWYSPFGTLIVVLALGIPFAYGLLRYVFRVRISWLNSKTMLTWQGLCFVLFPVVVIAEVLNLITPLDQIILGYMTIGAWALVGAFSCFHASRLVVREVKIKADESTLGKSIVQITDVHTGSRTTKFLTNVVRQVEALNPDYVVITGDLVDSSSVTRDDLSPLETLSAPTIFTIGNHERYEDCDAIVNWLESMGLVVLRNRSIELGPFQFVGIDDADSSEQVKAKLEFIERLEDHFRILLYHRPLGAHDASTWGIDLMLSGHTHRGQVFPFNFLVNRFFKYTHGDHDIDGMLLHVSTGTGTWGPQLRLGSRNEVTHLVFE